ncbi:MAG: chaperone modulator CbpM [Bacteroidetes bacterium]|nr:chaperone modulator CbpM [Bacteroidota bacterium]
MQDLISREECCLQYNVESSFIQALYDFGLIEITTVAETTYLYTEQLNDLEKFIRLHYDLNINIEGIDAIANLLMKVRDLQQQNQYLRKRLLVLGDDEDNTSI